MAKLYANVLPYFLLPVKTVNGKLEKQNNGLVIRVVKTENESEVKEEIFELKEGNLYPFLVFPLILFCFLVYTLFVLFTTSIIAGLVSVVIAVFFSAAADYWLDAVLGFLDWKAVSISYVTVLFVLFLMFTVLFPNFAWVHFVVVSIVPVSFQSTVLATFLSFYLEIEKCYALKEAPYYLVMKVNRKQEERRKRRRRV